MPIRKPKPTSPGLRFVSYPDFSEITKTEPEKTLTEGLKKSGGRNSNGRKTARHRGGGAKRLYRKIDFKRRKDGIPARVAAIEYDPNRTAYIALLHYLDGEKRYILAPNRLQVGMTVQSGADAPIDVGNACRWRSIPTGTVVHNVELQPGRGGQLAPLGRHRRPADGEGGRHGHAAPALRRDADGPRGVPRDRRRRSATPTTRTSRSARPAASATSACARRRAAPP